MLPYRYGMIFNLDRHLRMMDPMRVFYNVDHFRLVDEIIGFLTDGIENSAQAREQINDISYLMDILYEKEIVPESIFQQNESYVKVCGVLFSICESILQMFEETLFYSYLRKYAFERPHVINVSRHNYAILIKRKP